MTANQIDALWVRQQRLKAQIGALELHQHDLPTISSALERLCSEKLSVDRALAEQLSLLVGDVEAQVTQ